MNIEDLKDHIDGKIEEVKETTRLEVKRLEEKLDSAREVLSIKLVDVREDCNTRNVEQNLKWNEHAKKHEDAEKSIKSAAAWLFGLLITIVGFLTKLIFFSSPDVKK